MIVFPRNESGLRAADDSYLFGKLGEVEYVTIHHSAGPRAPTKARCQELNRAYQIDHENQGWGDIGYHFCMDDLGRYYRLRPHTAKGAHTLAHNYRNIGIMLHGSYSVHTLTDAQKDALKWLFQGGFYALFGEVEAGIKGLYGHREWPDNQTECPGDNLMRHWAWLRANQSWGS